MPYSNERGHYPPDGPYHVVVEKGKVFVLTTDNVTMIATVSGGFTLETQLATARLIAAAPQLVEALKAISESDNEIVRASLMGDGWIEAHKKFAAFARAALTLVEGK